ncbi:unnamed protein product [Absidia cylindrospora]
MMMINIAQTKTAITRQASLWSRQEYMRMAPALLHTSSTQQKSIVEKAKDLGENLNKKVGQKLAEGIEGAEHVVHKAPNVKDLGHKANLKAGEKIAEGIEGAENIAHKAPSAKNLGEKVKQAGHDVNLKVGQTLAGGIDKAENSAGDLKDKAETVRNKAEHTKEEAKDTVDKAKHRLENEAEDIAGNLKRKVDKK